MSWWLVGFARRGPARYLSHLDTARTVQRTFARAGVPIALSHGMFDAVRQVSDAVDDEQHGDRREPGRNVHVVEQAPAPVRRDLGAPGLCDLDPPRA